MRFWLISDTHNKHSQLVVPDQVDIVIHCGDESDSGNKWQNETEARDFFDWYSSLPISRKVYVPGNHSTAVEQQIISPEEYSKITFLIHQQTQLDGLTIFGTPYTPTFFNWSYMRPREELDILWQTIPTDIDILISHGPPKGVLDATCDLNSGEPIHVGSKSLLQQVQKRIQPKLHAFGHIHDEPGLRNFGVIQSGEIMFANCSCCNLSGDLVNHGIVLTLDSSQRRFTWNSSDS